MSGITHPSFRTSRRYIVKSGVRLAYAAPIVAASMHLHGGRSEAISIGAGGPLVSILTGSQVTHVCSAATGFTNLRQVAVSGSGWTPGGSLFVVTTGTGVFAPANAFATADGTGAFGPVPVGFVKATGGLVTATVTDLSSHEQTTHTAQFALEVPTSCAA